MSTTKSAFVAGAVILALVVGTSCYEAFALQNAEASLHLLNRDYAAMRASHQDAQQRVVVAQVDVNQLRKTLEHERATQEATRAQRATQAQAAKGAAEWDPVTEGNAFMARHPEVKQALIDWTNARVAARYGMFYKTLGLTSDQIERFQSLMRENYGGFGPPLGLNGEILSLRSGAGMDANKMAEALRELLGDAGFRQFHDFERSAAAQMYTERIVSALCFTETPITLGQADELVKILAASEVARNASQPRRFNWDEVAAKAEEVLLPPQRAALAGMRAQDEYQQAFSGFRNSRAVLAPATGGAPAK